MNELKRMNWNEWIDMNDLWSSSWKSGKTIIFLDNLMWSTTWWRCGRQMKFCSRFSRARTLSTSLSTSSSKSWKKPVRFSRFLCVIELSLQSRAHFDNLIFKKWKTYCFTFFLCNRALATVSLTFCRSHLQKVSRSGQFLTILLWNRALATVSCRFCRPLSGSRRATTETDSLQSQPRTATLPEKTEGFAPGSVFSREFTRSRSLTLPNYLMMVWLTWWCGWHDDWDDDVVAMMVRQLAIDNRP